LTKYFKGLLGGRRNNAKLTLKVKENRKYRRKERTERVEIEFTELEKYINLLNCEGKDYPYLYNLKII
jgi:hypothetical protein